MREFYELLDAMERVTPYLLFVVLLFWAIIVLSAIL